MAETNKGFEGAEVFLEIGDSQFDMAKVEEKVRKEIRKTTRAKIEDLKIYVKPEDNKAYYTAKDGELSGSIDL